ncbi:MAG: hypothetical protein WB778_03140 [Thermoplasmata archaeon]
MTIDELTTLAVAASWAAVVGTIVLMYWQTRQAQKLNSGNAVIALREQFDKADMRRSRRRLAHGLLSGDANTPVPFDIARFFELIGYLTHRGILEDTLVWDAFGGWITSYYVCMRSPVDRIGNARNEFRDHLIFGEFEWLNNRMVTLDSLRLGGPIPPMEELVQDGRMMLGHESKMDDLSD